MSKSNLENSNNVSINVQFGNPNTLQIKCILFFIFVIKTHLATKPNLNQHEFIHRLVSHNVNIHNFTNSTPEPALGDMSYNKCAPN